MTAARQQVVAEALSWLGTPYHHRGAIKGVGVDCAQILVEVYSSVGLIERIDVGNYPKDWHLHRDEERYINWMKQHARKVDKPQAGDIALFKFGRTTSHSAIVIDDHTLLHAYFDSGVVLAEFDAAELKGRLTGYWSLWSNE